METNPFSAPKEADPVAALLSEMDLEPYKVDRGIRFLGALVDGLASFGGAFVVGVPLAFLLPSTMWEDPELGGNLVTLLAMPGSLVIAVVNWWLMVDRGQSLGKMVVGSRVVRESGGPVDFTTGVVLRSWVFGVLGSLCGLVNLADAVAIFGDKRQCLHDMLAKTVVVGSEYDPYGGEPDIEP